MVLILVPNDIMETAVCEGKTSSLPGVPYGTLFGPIIPPSHFGKGTRLT